LIGSLVWNSALIGAGYLLRDQWEDVEPIMEKFQYVVILAFLVAGLAYVWVKFLSPKARSGETKERSRDEEVIADWDAAHGKA
jgi:membrane protein DedA with SNARE-associated domain